MGSPVRLAYLTLYNSAGLLGWGYILSQIFTIISQGRYTALWKEHGYTIKGVQTMAVMEIVHALLGIVPSPILRTFPQVFSRVYLVWMIFDSLFVHPYTPFSLTGCGTSLDEPLCTEEMAYQLGCMTVMAWCYAELIRYSYYILYTFNPKFVPGVLNWLRYSGFIILYPVGVSGELLCCFLTIPLHRKGLCASFEGLMTSCPKDGEFWLYVYMAMYIPAFPMLYFGLLGERKKRLNPKPAPKLQGVVFPVTKKGDRSTSNTGKEIFAKAMEAVSPEEAQKVRKEKNWRWGYDKHVEQHVVMMAGSEEKAMKMAQAGLDYMYDTFDFITLEGGQEKTVKLREAMEKEVESKYHSVTIRGEKPKPAKFEVGVPYKCFHTQKDHGELKGLQLIEQVNKWVDEGSMEPDAGDAIKKVVQNSAACDLTNEWFVLLGATSAMGPFLILKELGANIIAVDLDRPQIWKKIVETVKDSCATVTFPLKEPYKNQEGEELYKIAGCNIMNDVPYIAKWLKEVVPKKVGNKPVTIGGYAYLDGELHVRVNLACDAIMNACIKNFGAKNVRLANLMTPTDCFLVTKDAYAACEKNYKEAPLWQKLLSLLAFPLFNRLVPNTRPPLKFGSNTLEYVDNVTREQGPNYALAKRLQQWRGILARAQGATVSMNIAPATATQSVVSNKTFALAYGALHNWKPMEVFYQEVSNAVMGTLLIHDVFFTSSAAYPSFKLEHPMLLFIQNAFHGGAMRCSFQMKSTGEATVMIALLKKYMLLLLLSFVAAIGGAVVYLG